MMDESTAKMIAPLAKLVLIVYVMNKTHTVNNLLMLEFLVMMILLNLFSAMASMEMELYMIFFMLIIMVSESITGLSILISMVRTHSSDYLKSSMLMY